MKYIILWAFLIFILASCASNKVLVVKHTCAPSNSFDILECERFKP